MPCYACSAEYGILRKEIGCSVCGFSFCSKCCKKREVPIETGELKKIVICVQCINKKPSSGNDSNISPPLAHKKRMEAFKKQSASVDSASHALLQSQWSDDKDKEIAERLQKLKRDRIKDLPSEGEIEERIAKLKGMDPSKYKAPPIEVFRPADRRTSIEKANDLINQYKEEADIESKIVKPEDEIAARLARLRAYDTETGQSTTKEETVSKDSVKITSGDLEIEIDNIKGDDVESLIKQAKLAVSSSAPSSEDVEMSEEEEAEKLVEKFMAAKFDDMENLDSLNDQESDKSLGDQTSPTEEFPWCIICSEDAKIRCFGCSSDLYCLRCFKECHDSLDIKDHKTCPFLAPKNPML